jgi:hypothetical protein
MTLSKARLRLRNFVNEQAKLMIIFMARKPLLRGGIYQASSKCGKPNCVCVREGKLHIAWRFYWTEDGKTLNRVLSKSEVDYYQKLTRNYRRFRKARARLVKIHKEMIELINILEKGMTKESVRGYIKRERND